MALYEPPDSFIPQFYLTAYSRFSYQLMFTSLLTFTPDLKLKGWLADKWEASRDAKTFTFHIRENAFWTDGKPITAEDVEFTILAMTDPGYGGLEGVLVSPILGAAERRAGKSKELPGVKVIDPKTVQITTAQPFASLFGALGVEMLIIPKHAVQQVPPKDMRQHPFALAPTATSGPFKFVRYQTNQFVEYEANDKYFLGRPNLDKVIIKIVGADVALAQLERTEIDMIPGQLSQIRPFEVERLKKLAHVNIMPMPGNFLAVLALNHVNPKLTDVRVRKALAHAIDAKAIVDKVFLGYAKVNRAPKAINFPYYMGAELGGYAHDPAKSRALLKEAGWDARTELVLRHSTAFPFTDVSPVIQSQFGAVGVNLKIEQGDLSQILALVRTQPEKFDIGMWGYRDYIDPDTFLTRIYHSSARPAPNYSRYSNPKVDALLDQGRSIVDEKERRGIYLEAQRIILDDVAVVPLMDIDEIGAVNKRLQGVVPTVIRLTDNIHEWYVTN